MLVKRLTAVVVAAVAAAVVISPLGGASGAATPAKRDVCGTGRLCVWAKPNANADGQKVTLRKLGISNKLAREMNDKASSAINNRDGAIFLYDKRDAKGDAICMEPQSKANLATFNFDNKASSSKLTNKNNCPV